MRTLLWLTPLFLSACVSKVAFDIDQSLIDDVMAQNKRQFDQCFFQARNQNPSISGGRIVMRFEHSVDGHFVAPRTLQRFIGSDPVEECLEQTLASIKTERPRTRGPVDFEWSFDAVASRNERAQ
jgi:hypothetical protein